MFDIKQYRQFILSLSFQLLLSTSVPYQAKFILSMEYKHIYDMSMGNAYRFYPYDPTPLCAGLILSLMSYSGLMRLITAPYLHFYTSNHNR
jgi:uncharacterized membrane protein